MQNQANVWRDVTLEILNYGIGAPRPGAAGCAASNAIIVLQRLRDDINTCSSTNSSEFWPNSLFDAREALLEVARPLFPELAQLEGVRALERVGECVHGGDA